MARIVTYDSSVCHNFTAPQSKSVELESKMEDEACRQYVLQKGAYSTSPVPCFGWEDYQEAGFRKKDYSGHTTRTIVDGLDYFMATEVSLKNKPPPIEKPIELMTLRNIMDPPDEKLTLKYIVSKSDAMGGCALSYGLKFWRTGFHIKRYNPEVISKHTKKKPANPGVSLQAIFKDPRWCYQKPQDRIVYPGMSYSSFLGLRLFLKHDLTAPDVRIDFVHVCLLEVLTHHTSSGRPDFYENFHEVKRSTPMLQKLKYVGSDCFTCGFYDAYSPVLPVLGPTQSWGSLTRTYMFKVRVIVSIAGESSDLQTFLEVQVASLASEFQDPLRPRPLIWKYRTHEDTFMATLRSFRRAKGCQRIACDCGLESKYVAPKCFLAFSKTLFEPRDALYYALDTLNVTYRHENYEIIAIPTDEQIVTITTITIRYQGSPSHYLGALMESFESITGEMFLKESFILSQRDYLTIVPRIVGPTDKVVSMPHRKDRLTAGLFFLSGGKLFPVTDEFYRPFHERYMDHRKVDDLNATSLSIRELKPEKYFLYLKQKYITSTLKLKVRFFGLDRFFLNVEEFYVTPGMKVSDVLHVDIIFWGQMVFTDRHLIIKLFHVFLKEKLTFYSPSHLAVSKTMVRLHELAHTAEEVVVDLEMCLFERLCRVPGSLYRCRIPQLEPTSFSDLFDRHYELCFTLDMELCGNEYKASCSQPIMIAVDEYSWRPIDRPPPYVP